MFNEFIPYAGLLARGLKITLILTLGSGFLAALAAPLCALCYVYGSKIVAGIVRVYISFIRGTPLLAQLFLVYYGSGEFHAELEAAGLWFLFEQPLSCAVLVFAINSCAYQTEILRGGINAVSRGEIEAGQAIGMTRCQIIRRIILPHSYRTAWPALGNELILLLKASALASVVTIFDLMGRTRQVFASNFDFSVYLWAALLYLGLTAVFVVLWRLVERYLSKHMNNVTQGETV